MPEVDCVVQRAERQFWHDRRIWPLPAALDSWAFPQLLDSVLQGWLARRRHALQKPPSAGQEETTGDN